MERRDVDFIAVKRRNMIKSVEEAEYFLSKVRKKIKTLFSVADNLRSEVYKSCKQKRSFGF